MQDAIISVYWADLDDEHRAVAESPPSNIPLRPYRSTHVQYLSTLSKLLLNSALQQQPPYPDAPLSDMRYHADGKPYLPDSHYAFSLTHSGQLAACAIAKKGPVGIDIQERVVMRPGTDRFFMTDEERERVAGEDVLALWSQKEAAFKAFGHDLDARLTDFRFDGPLRLSCGEQSVQVQPIETPPGYVGYVAYDPNIGPVTVQVDYV